jgi:hypothetical protein
MIVLALLALLAIGAASARDWRAGPQMARPGVPVIVLRPAPQVSARVPEKPKARKKVAVRRTVRNPRSVPASPRRNAVTPAGRGGPPAAAPERAPVKSAETDNDDGGDLRENSAATPTRRPAPKPVAARDDPGAAPVPAPPPATAGGGGDEGADGSEGDEGDDGVDSDVGGDADD